MTRPDGRRSGSKRSEQSATKEPEKGLTIVELMVRRLETHPRYPAVVGAFERNVAPIQEFLESLGATVANMLAAHRRAKALSDLLHSQESGMSDVQDTLKIEPIDNAMTLLLLLQLERQRGESGIEREVVERIREQAREHGKHGAEIRHNKPGGARDKRRELRAIWASGKYTTRAVCAEQEYAALGIALDTARKYLKGTPEPGKEAGR